MKYEKYEVVLVSIGETSNDVGYDADSEIAVRVWKYPDNVYRLEYRELDERKGKYDFDVVIVDGKIKLSGARKHRDIIFKALEIFKKEYEI